MSNPDENETPLVIDGDVIEAISIEQLEHLAESGLPVAGWACNILAAADNASVPNEVGER